MKPGIDQIKPWSTSYEKYRIFEIHISILTMYKHFKTVSLSIF